MLLRLAGDTAQEDAELMHENALSEANDGNLEEALPLFKKATELNPNEDSYWSNYGVTLMRLSYLDEALLAYTRGLRVNPRSQLIKDNMKALNEHISHQSQGAGFEEEDSAHSRFGEEESPVQKQQQQQQPARQRRANNDAGQPSRGNPPYSAGSPPSPPASPRGARSAGRGGSTMTGSSRVSKGVTSKGEAELESWLGPWWKKRHKFDGLFKDALTNLRPIQIRNFLEDDKALALHDELYDSNGFKVYESYNRWYQFHFKAIYMHTPEYQTHKLLKKIGDLFDIPVMKEWIRDISASEVNGTTLAGASYYAAGDYTMPHTDKAGGGNGDREKRRIAYIVHLTKAWNPRFGGDMVWMNPAFHIHPSFNSITMFPVSKSSWHFVSPVAEITPDHVKVDRSHYSLDANANYLFGVRCVVFALV